MKKTAFVSIVFLVAIVFSTNIDAQMRKKVQKEKFRSERIEKLNLTEDQKEQIDQLRFDQQEKMIDLKAEVEKKELELKKVQASDNLNREQLIKLAEDIHSVKGKIAMLKINHWMDVYEMLTTEQREVWKEMKMDFDKKPRMKRDKLMERKRELIDQ